MRDRHQLPNEEYESDNDDNNSYISNDTLSLLDEEVPEKEQEANLAKRDSANVRISMAIVLGMLGITATLVVTMTYIFLSNAQEDEFETAVSSK